MLFLFPHSSEAVQQPQHSPERPKSPTSVTQGNGVTFEVGFSESTEYYLRVENSTDEVVRRYPKNIDRIGFEEFKKGVL